MIDWQDIELKWQSEWSNKKVAESDVNPNEKKFYMVFAYPYPTGFLHTGHMRGYTYADDICRFKRLTGYNVLLPVGIHATGNGAISKSQKITEKDEQYISYLRENGVPEQDIDKMKDPEQYIKYFGHLYLNDFKRFGLLVDERTFITTIDDIYKKFITWQFNKLNDKGLLIQKEYYATFCEHCGPVSVDASESDISKGGGAEKNEYTLLKFETRYNDQKAYIIAATLRPETVFGQTNLWIDPDIDYAVIKVGGEIWIGSKEFAHKLKYQKDNVNVIGTINGKDILGKHVKAPGIDREIIVLPSKFCEPDVGSGIVTSVPSDAPHDWMGLYDLQNNETECKKYEKYGLNCDEIKAIKPIPIINTPGWGEMPAVEICKKMHIKNSMDPKLESAKKEIYKSGFYTGTMRDVAGKYAGLSVEKAKEQVKKELIEKGQADIFYDLSEEVICRCGRKVFIKKVDHQWFIDYGKEWLNNDSISWAKNMNVKPDDYYENLPEALRWFKERPCARMGRWMGTTFPFDKRYIIEAISDSTLYPIFYLVSKHKDKFNADQLTLKFFDYIFLGKGSADDVAQENNMKKEDIEIIRREILYWYPLDINLGGKEHKTVHFPPFIKNHVAVLPRELWPRGIFVNYWITTHGKEKLSKSKGGAQPIHGAIKKFGVDPMRLFYANSAKPYVDVEFSEDLVFEYRNRLEYMYNEIKRLWELSNRLSDKLSDDSSGPQGKNGKNTSIDNWLNTRIKWYLYQSERDIDTFELKHASDIAYYHMLSDIQWYLKRKGNNKHVLRNAIEVMVKLMSVFTPHIAEEIWHEVLGKDELIANSKLPEIEKINMQGKDSEWYIKNIIDDISNILKVIKKNKPNKITLVIADDWKYKMIKKAMSIENRKEIMNTLMNDPEFIDKRKDIAMLIKRLIRMLPEYKETPSLDEMKILNDAVDYLTDKFGCQIKIINESDAEIYGQKAKNALPLKPAIMIE